VLKTSLILVLTPILLAVGLALLLIILGAIDAAQAKMCDRRRRAARQGEAHDHDRRGHPGP
jgi:hypothetical protein